MRVLTILLAALALSVGIVSSASAADKAGPNFLDPPAVQPKSAWTGCGIGAYGSLLNGDVDTGSTTNFGSNGQEAGLSGSCDVALGALVIGAGVDYGRAFGDLKDIGLNASMSGYGRAGVLLSANTMLYALAGRSRLDTSAGNLEGWVYGGGIETKLQATQPVFLRLEYRKGTYDLSDIGGPNLDADVQTVRLGLTYKFNFSN